MTPARLPSAQQLVNAQAEDEGLWFEAATATEAYLQAALRELHAAVEHDARAALEPQAKELTRSQKLAAAGFTARDMRLTCDECGARFTLQFAPLHKCAGDPP